MSEVENEEVVEKKWVDPALYFPNRRGGVRKAKGPLLPEISHSRRMEIEDDLRNRRLRLEEIREERKRDAESNV